MSFFKKRISENVIQMFKKIHLGYVLIFLSLFFLSACSKEVYTEQDASISYEKIKNILISELEGLNIGDGANQILSEEILLNSDAIEGGLESDFSIKLNVTSDKDQTQSYFYFSGEIFDIEKEERFVFNWDMFHVIKDDNEFIKMNTGNISFGRSKAEDLLIQMLLDNMHDKWILLDDPEFINLNAFDLRRRHNIPEIMGKIADFFSSKEPEVKEKGNNIFYITHDHEDISYFLTEIYNIWGVNLEDGYDIKKYIDPRNDVLYVEFYDGDNDISMTGVISDKYREIYLQVQENEYFVNMNKNRLSYDFDVLYKNKGQNVLKTKMNIRNRNNANAILSYRYKGKIELFMPSIFLEDIYDKAYFDISGDYVLKAGAKNLFEYPKSYFIISEMFADEYGLLNILDN